MIRDYRPYDEPVLRRIHAEQGFDYPFPDLSEFEEVLVVTDEDNLPVQMVAARKTVEIYFMGDPEWRTPAWRLDALKGLHEVLGGLLKEKGYTDALAFIPPKVVKAFGRRLERDFGWIRGRWQHFCKYL
jgi:hypothetical protein